MATKRTDSTDGGPEKNGGAGSGGSNDGSAPKTSAAKKSGRAAKKAGAVKSGTTALESGETSAAAKQPRASRGGAPATGRSKQSDLKADARNFASSRPDGWSHDEWLGFLEGLRERGHNIEDKDAIGSILERERLGVLLEKVPGIGAQRVRAIAERYGNVWRLKAASADELTQEANIPRPLAERIVEAVR